MSNVELLAVGESSLQIHVLIESSEVVITIDTGYPVSSAQESSEGQSRSV